MQKVSVIIPCYNKGDFIAEAIESVLNQTYKNIEIIIINDASTDNSAEIINTYADKYNNIKFVNQEENQGVIKTRNNAIKMATAEYILPLDADDYIHPEYVEKAVNILENNKSIGVVYCLVNFIGDKEGKLNCQEFSENYLLYSSCISSCSMFRKEDFVKCGGYKEYMKYGCEDWDLWLSFYENGYGFYRINETMLFYRRINDLESRTLSQKENIKLLWTQMVKNHFNLYLNNELFIEKVFTSQRTINNLTKKIKKIKKKKKRFENKYKKYKTIFKCMLMSYVFILALIIYLMVRQG